jgi:AraC family transcriptional activator of pobA
MPLPDQAPTPGSRSFVAVPRYVLYGDAGNRTDWFVNVEPLDQRCRERGWVIKPHTHPRFCQLMLVSAGGGAMIVEGEVQPFAPGSVMVVPPHVIHGFDYQQDTQGWVITIENHYFDDLMERAPALRLLLARAGVVNLAPDSIAALAPDFATLANELASNAIASAIGAEIGLMGILLQLYRQWPEGGPAPAPGNSRHRLVERYRTLVEARFHTQPSLAVVATELGVSVSQLRLACDEVAGMSPLAILHARLLAEARRYLAYTALPIAEIAATLGFSEASYFTRFFTRKMGQTPSQWRHAIAARV